MTTATAGAATKGYFFESRRRLEASYKKIANGRLAFADLSGTPIRCIDDDYAAGTMFKRRIARL
jgi:hypothetical protein